jgi:hypothetical protein
VEAASFFLTQSGSAAEITQNHKQLKESIHWTRRSYNLGSQSLLLDALDHSKDEIRSQYDTYVTRLDTLILVLALIWPLALNTIQFSDAFVPGLVHEKNCPECMEVEYRWTVYVWVGFLGGILILPFWGILMLIRVKMKLDSWLEYSLAGIHLERRHIIDEFNASGSDNQQEGNVTNLVGAVFRYQDYLGRIWSAECGWLVHAATTLLWLSAYGGLLLVSLSMLVFFVDKGGHFKENSPLFTFIIGTGCVTPAFYVLYMKCYGRRAVPPEGQLDVMAKAGFPLADARVQKCPPSPRRCRSSSGSFLRDASPLII